MSSETTESNVAPVSAPQESRSERRTGRVKWFGKGYGFITDIDDTSREYFVHHTALVVSEPTDENQTRVYKRLEKGEYIECSVIKDGENRDCAVDVTGIRRGALMCESNPSSPIRRPQRRHRYRSRSRSRSRSSDRSRGRDRSRSRRRYHRRRSSYDDDDSRSRSRSRSR
jgi:cold shock CspA family protein